MLRAGIEPAQAVRPRDFKSLVSTNSTTAANNEPALSSGQKNEGMVGLEPTVKALQASALPLGDIPVSIRIIIRNVPRVVNLFRDSASGGGAGDV